MKFQLSDFRKALPELKDVQTFIMDPPYNIKFDYKSKYKDNLDPEQYKQTIKEGKNDYYLANYSALPFVNSIKEQATNNLQISEKQLRALNKVYTRYKKIFDNKNKKWGMKNEYNRWDSKESERKNHYFN